MRKDRLDMPGLAGLLAVTALLAANQVIVKQTNQGLQPVFFAGLRSVLATFAVLAWLRLRRRPLRLPPGTLGPGLLIGVIFAVEFLCLFMALDLTTVSRAAILFYSMPLWLSLAAHVGLPGERLTPLRSAGLLLAFLGTALALADRNPGPGASLTGDLFALAGAIGWAGTAFMARRPTLAAVGPEMQLLWMVAVSGPVLLLLAPAFGPLIRDLQASHLFWLGFQAVVVVAGGFIAWLALLARYPTATVASFSFLTPLLSLTLGWLWLGEALSPMILVAAGLVAAGIILINRPRNPQ